MFNKEAQNHHLGGGQLLKATSFPNHQSMHSLMIWEGSSF